VRGRLLAAIIVLCVVIAAVWEARRLFSPPVTPTEAPSVAVPIVPPPPVITPPPAPALKKTVPKYPKKIVSPKKTATAVTSIPPEQTRPPIPIFPLPPVAPEPQEWRGNSDTSIKHSGQIVVINDHQWIRFWAEHHPDEVAPEIDFSQKMVVGVFQGRRPADAFRVDIVSVRALPGALVVDYIERAPPPGTFQVAVEAYPYDIKVIPRSALHVKFNELKAQYQPSPYQRPASSSAPAPASK
jgi:hypothetical protein